MDNKSYYYCYSDNDTGFGPKQHVIKAGSIAVPLFFTIVVVLSLVGNILVLVILGRYETLRSLTNIFILNLALSDLMFTAGLPFWSYHYIWGWTSGSAMCKGVNFVFYAGYYSSIVFLMLMTIQRYVAVVHPLLNWERGQWFVVIPILAWVMSIAAALPALLYTEVTPDPEEPDSEEPDSEEPDLLFCEFNSTSANFDETYQQNISFVVAFVVMGFCYIRILQTIFRGRTKKKHRTIRLIFGIVTVFFVGWAPYNIVLFLKTFTDHLFDQCHVSTNLDYALYVCELLAFSHCCLNPVFYVFVVIKFRNHLKSILYTFHRRESNTDSFRTRITTIQSQGSL